MVAIRPVQVALHERRDLLRPVHVGGVQIRLEVVQFVGVRLVGKDRRAVVVSEGLGDRVGVVQEVEHEHVVLLGVRPVEPRQGLDRLDPGERLVDVHGVEQRLVVAGLELVRADEEAVRILLERLGDLVRRETVQRGLAHLLPAVFVLSPEKATIAS